MSRHRKGNSFRDMNVPGDPRTLDAITRRTPNIAGGGISHVFGSTIIVPKSKKGRIVPFCPFGTLTTWDTGEGESLVHHAAIIGGIIFCGDKTWNIDNQELDLETDGVWLVSIAVTAEGNRDDDETIFLPGVKTGTEPSGTWTSTTWTTGTDYPDGTIPVVSTGEGVVILPIGKVTIASGVATFEKAGCGHFRIQQCAGQLSFTRE